MEQYISNLDPKDDIVIFGFGVIIIFIVVLLTLHRYNQETEKQRSAIRNKHMDYDQIISDFDTNMVRL